MNRFKNYGLWVSFFAFIPLVVDTLGTYDIDILLPANYSELVKGILGMLVLLGLINNPDTENRGFSDDN